jgi:hypothetical protein
MKMKIEYLEDGTPFIRLSNGRFIVVTNVEWIERLINEYGNVKKAD